MPGVRREARAEKFASAHIGEGAISTVRFSVFWAFVIIRLIMIQSVGKMGRGNPEVAESYVIEETNEGLIIF